jgi:hypothetical protein
MIFQFLVGQNLIDGAPGSSIIVPFVGKCRLKIIKLDYQFNTAGAIQQRLIAINSRVLINYTPLSGRILFFNTTNPYYNDTFIIDDILINGTFDIRLTDEVGAVIPLGYGGGAVNGGYLNCLITLDIEYMDKLKISS